MKALKPGPLSGVMFIIGTLVYCLSGCRQAPTTQEIQAALEASGPQELRDWAVNFVGKHPECTNIPHGERVTNAPVSAIGGVYPYAYTSRTGEADPFLVSLEWDRYGPKVLVGATNFHFTSSKAIMWRAGIYITQRDDL